MNMNLKLGRDRYKILSYKIHRKLLGECNWEFLTKLEKGLIRIIYNRALDKMFEFCTSHALSFCHRLL